MSGTRKAPADAWQVYVLRCSDGSLYTGITTDVARRVAQHAGNRGAKYFRGREPVALAYLEGGHDRRSASRREAAIKALSRAAKEALIADAERATATAMRLCGLGAPPRSLNPEA